MRNHQAQCKVFNTVFNPEGHRMGTKILRERLKGPSVASYYPRRIGTFNDLAKLYPEWEGLDLAEWDRQENVAAYVIPVLPLVEGVHKRLRTRVLVEVEIAVVVEEIYLVGRVLMVMVFQAQGSWKGRTEEEENRTR